MASLSGTASRWLAQRFELQRGGSGNNLLAMEGLRGLAVALVFLVHFGTLVEPWLARDAALSQLVNTGRVIGHAGVDLFFVLSGYLIYGTLITRRQAFGRYFWRRVQRIYPAFLAVFVLYLALSWGFPQENKLPKDSADAAGYVLQNLLLLPGLLPIEPLITVAWSLSYEMFYYLAMPALIALLQLRRWSPSARVSGFVAMSAAALVWGGYFGGHVRLVMFLAGVVLFEVVQKRAAPPTHPLLALLALVLALAAMTLPITGSLGQALRSTALFVGFFLLCHAAFTQSKGWFNGLWTWTPMRWLGNMSYSYYLIHGLALKAIFLLVTKLLPVGSTGPLFAAWVLLPAFLLTLLPSALLFLLVERPLSLGVGKSVPTAPERLASAGGQP